MNSGFGHRDGVDRMFENRLQFGLAFPQRFGRLPVLDNFREERFVGCGQFRGAFLDPVFQLVAGLEQRCFRLLSLGNVLSGADHDGGTSGFTGDDFAPGVHDSFGAVTAHDSMMEAEGLVISTGRLHLLAHKRPVLRMDIFEELLEGERNLPRF